MKGGYGDNYYMLMTNCIRKYKGVPPLQKVGDDAKKTININGPFSQWDSVKTQYRDYTNDIIDRNIAGYGELHYMNTTGRNDFDVMKVAFDAHHLYFYVKTVDAIKDSTAENAMTLYLRFPQMHENADVPNWEGYHFAVNRAASEATDRVIIEDLFGEDRLISAFAACKVEGNQMQIAVPYRLLLCEILKLDYSSFNAPVNVQFKWADNCPVDGDVSSFYTDGDAAPIGRLNYVFAE
jgi:hypothetical protein